MHVGGMHVAPGVHVNFGMFHGNMPGMFGGPGGPPAGGGQGGPAPQDLIDALEEVCLDKADVERGNEQCGVCLGDQAVGDRAVLLSCRHAFCKSCIQTWLGRQCVCPVCRTPVRDPRHPAPPGTNWFLPLSPQ